MEKCPLAENGNPGQEEYLERVLVGSRQCGGLLNSDVNLSNREDPGKAPALYFYQNIPPPHEIRYFALGKFLFLF